MLLIISNENYRIRIQESFDRISDHYQNALLHDLPIIITDANDALNLYNDGIGLFEKSYINGFGGIKGNIVHDGERKHIIVLNMENIDELELNEIEIDGVLSHELGHIFNKYVPTPIPSIINGASMAEVNEVKASNGKNNEFYADYFSNLTESSDGLISSLQKFLNSRFCNNSDFINERIEMLNNNAEFNGELLGIQI